MTIFEKIDEYITGRVKEGQSYNLFGITGDEEEQLKEDAMETCQGGCKTWIKGFIPKYSLSHEDKDVPGIIGRYHGVNIVRKP